MIIVNSKLPPEIHTALKKFTDSVIPSPVASKLPRELSAHPDMLIHVSPKGLICAPELHAPLKALGVDSIKGGKDPMLSRCYGKNSWRKRHAQRGVRIRKRKLL